MLKKGYFKMDDFAGGLVTKGSPLSLKPNQSPDQLNTISDIYKSCQTRNGYAKLNGTTAAAVCNGIYNYKNSDTTQYLVSLWGSGLKKMDVVSSAWDGTWDTITANANRGTAVSDSTMYNTSYSGDCIITTEGRDVPQKYNPTDNANYTDLDWETSHAYVEGDVTTYTATSGDKLKITINGTAFDNVDLTSDASIANVVTSINAASGLAAKGIAIATTAGYLRIYSNTRGSGGSVVVEYGSGDANGTCVAALFDGDTTITATTIGANIAPSAKHCTEWKSFVWLANTSTYPDRLYRSAAGDATSWTATEYETVSTPGDIGVTGFATLRGRLLVFKKHSIHLVTYLGGTPLLDVKQVNSNTGTSSPRSIVNVDIPGEGEIIFFFGTDLQWYMFDGQTAVPISEDISTYNSISKYCMIGDGSAYGLNPATLSSVHAVHYPRRHWVVLFFCLDNDTTPKDAFVYDYYAKAIYPFHFDDVFTASCIADNGAGQRLCYTGGTNYSWLFDSTNADDGDAISSYWTSPKLDLGSEVEMNDLRNINFTTDSSSATPGIQYKTNWDSSWSTSEALTASTETHTIETPRQADLVQFKISDSSATNAFELIRATVVAGKRGVDK